MTRVDTDRAPYVGPRPYAEDEQEIFFGRDAEIAELVSLVIAHRTVLLYAVSGAGKSSLLRAGVDARLREHGFEVLGPLRFQSPVAPPAEAPNVYSYAVLRALTVLQDTNGKQLDPSLAVVDFLAALPRGMDAYGFASPRVVILDQFEEMFTAYQERWQHREGFLRQLAEALDGDPELRIVFSMREEYIAALERYARLLPDGLRARCHLERLRAPAALAAVTGPPKLSGVDFDPGVAETLVHDLRETRVDIGVGAAALRVEGEFVEPVQLQVVCRTLWTRLDPTVRRVTAEDLVALGNVDDSLTRYYDDAIAGAMARTSVAEYKLRDELERLLITSAGTRATVFAGDETTASLAAALDELHDRHLIRAEWRAGGRWLELAHDRLIEPIRRANEPVRERHRRHRLRRLAIAGVVLSIALVVGAVAVSSVWFSRVTVPDVIGAKSSFEAEKLITAAGLKLAPQTKEIRERKVPPGTVLSQTPKAGEKAEKDSEVTILVAVGSGKVNVPTMVGQTPSEAEKTLREAGLTLGQASPQPVDPAAVVVSQIPAAGEIVTQGAPVDVFLREDRSGEATVPPIKESSREAYAQKTTELGLVPEVRTAFDESDKGTVFRVEPVPGTEVKAGDTITLFVSAGFPELAYDNNRDVLLADGADGSRLYPIAKGVQDERDPTWSADGGAVAFTSNGRVYLADLTRPDETPQPLTKKGEKFSDLAWAPTAHVNALAMAKIANGASDLCLGRVDRDGMTTSCKDEPDITIERKIDWAPDGRSILAGGVRTGTREFGIVRWKTSKPFSTDPADYSEGKLVTDTSKPDEGVLDATLSPNGKRMAIINVGASGRPELMLAKPDDFLLVDAAPLDVTACRVIWRPDGKELVVVRANDCFGSATGELIRLPVADPKQQTSLTLVGDNPAYQPLAAE